MASRDYIVKVLQEIEAGLLARPARINWDLVGDLSVTLAAQNEEREYGPAYGELPARLLNAYNSRKKNHLAAALSTTGWHCWADVETMARDAGAHVLDRSTPWQLRYGADVRGRRWKKGMQARITWNDEQNHRYTAVDLRSAVTARPSGRANFLVEWSGAVQPHFAEHQRAFKWYGFPPCGELNTAAHPHYSVYWVWISDIGWKAALQLYYYLPYICKGVALLLQSAKDAAELLEESRQRGHRGPVTMSQEGLTDWLENRGWEVHDLRPAAQAARGEVRGYLSAVPVETRDITMHAVPRGYNYTLSIQAGPGLVSEPGDEPGTATLVEVAVWRGRFGAPRGRFLPLVGDDPVPSMDMYELERLVRQLEHGAI